MKGKVGERGLALRVEGRIKRLAKAEKELLVAGRGAMRRLITREAKELTADRLDAGSKTDSEHES